MRKRDDHQFNEVVSYRILSIAVVVVVVVGTALGERSHTSRLPAIVLGPSVQISTDNSNGSHVESFLAFNPKDPSQLVASSIVSGDGEAAAVYVSRDAGRSWERSASFDAGVPPISGGDPIVYYDLSGAALFAGLCDESDCSLRVWRSSDGGHLWDSTAAVPGRGYDRQYLAIDATSGPFKGRIYAAGTNWVRRTTGDGYPVLAITSSIDGARTFLPATILDVTSDGQSHGFGGIADLLITSRGTLVVPIQSSPNLIPSPERQFYTLISENGGHTFSAPRPGLPIGLGPSGFRRFRTGSNIRAAIDSSSGAFADRIYVTYVEFENDRYDVKVTHSDDLGLSWSPAVTVNDNKGPNDISNAAIAINRDGIVSLVWNDRRDDAKGECFRLYVSASLDGGDTFLSNVRGDPHPTCPNTPRNWSASATVFSPGSGRVALSAAPSRFPNGGETQGLVATPDGRFHTAWINGESGVMQLWFTSFAVQPGRQNVGGVRHVNEASPEGDENEKTKEVATGRVDRTKEVALEVGLPVIDFDSKALGFTVRLKNRTSTAISGPLTIVLDNAESDFAGLTVSNADNGLTGKGAEWEIAVDGQLAPGAVSEPRSIRWRFDGQVPEIQTKLNAFLARFQVFTGGR